MGSSIDIKVLLGRKIRELRKRKGLTQSEFADKIEACERNVSKIECGKNFVTAEKLAKIMEVLEVEPHELFNFKSNDDTSKLKEELLTAIKNEAVDIRLLYQFYSSIK